MPFQSASAQRTDFLQDFQIYRLDNRRLTLNLSQLRNWVPAIIYFKWRERSTTFEEPIKECDKNEACADYLPKRHRAQENFHLPEKTAQEVGCFGCEQAVFDHCSHNLLDVPSSLSLEAISENKIPRTLVRRIAHAAFYCGNRGAPKKSRPFASFPLRGREAG
jgi:hypothetical protein